MRWALLWCLLLASGAQAHEIRPAYLQLTELAPEAFEMVWKEPVLAGRRLPIEPVLPSSCKRVSASPPRITGTASIRRSEVNCDLRSGALEIEGLSATLTDTLVRISYLNGETISAILQPSSPVLDLSQGTPSSGAYFVLGIEHLAFGIDHILFVVGLVLFIRSPWVLAKTITAFTVAHSLTMALSVLGWVTLPQGPVEAVIALSILFLARELMVPEAERSPITQASPWLMAFAFGLLHGFGFAGVLAEIGLPREALAASLVLFNLGLEAGQLLVIGAMLAAGWLGHRLLRRHGPLVERGLATAMGCMAGIWTVDRVMAII